MNETNFSDKIFFSQLAVSILGMVFSGTMAIVDSKNVSIYLPIFTSILFTLLPSPATMSNSNNALKLLQDEVGFIKTQMNLNKAEEEKTV